MTHVQTLFLQPRHGLAGDMFLGLLVDLGASITDIIRELETLNLAGWSIEQSQVSRNQLAATRISVVVEESDVVRHLNEIVDRIEASSMSEAAKRRAIQTFKVLASAEAEVHGIDIDAVHFHEVGAIDAIIDICGVCIALEALEIKQVVCGPLPGGTGTVTCAHGTLSVPVPAVVALSASGNFTLNLNQGDGEMVTPTGMALLVANGRSLTGELELNVRRMGFGAGTRPSSALRGSLGLARAVVTQQGDTSHTYVESITLLCTNVDDVSAEQLSFVIERCMDEGALDATATSCLMKKGRPGHRIEVMVRHEQVREMVQLMMRHTKTLGVRVQPVQRMCVPRRSVMTATPYGPISVKLSPYGVKPEYEDCATAARVHGVPVQTVQEGAVRAAMDFMDGGEWNDRSQ